MQSRGGGRREKWLGKLVSPLRCGWLRGREVNICFKNSMKHSPEGWTCNCPVECNTLSYSFSIVSTPFDPQELCPERSSSHNFLMKPFYDNVFERTMIRMKYNLSNVEYCKTQLKYRAEVTFRLATDSMSVTVMSRRLTFYDKMSAFGNKIKFSFFKHHYLFTFSRWHFGIVYWNQYSQFS